MKRSDETLQIEFGAVYEEDSLEISFSVLFVEKEITFNRHSYVAQTDNYLLVIKGKVMNDGLDRFSISPKVKCHFSRDTTINGFLAAPITTDLPNGYNIPFVFIADVPKTVLFLARGVAVEFDVFSKSFQKHFQLVSRNNWVPQNCSIQYCSDIIICAKYAYEQKKYEKAVMLYKKAALLGSADAQYNLAKMLQGGLGADKDDTVALKCFLLAAKQGYTNAYICLAKCFHYGVGNEKNEIEAMTWLAKANEYGIKEAEKCFRDWYSDVTYNLQEIKECCAQFISSKSHYYSDKRSELLVLLGLDNQEVYLAYDFSVFNRARSGFAITRDGLYYRDDKKKPIIHISFFELSCAAFYGKISRNRYYICVDNKPVYFGSSNQEDYYELLLKISTSI